MTLAWDLENLRKLVRMRVGDLDEQATYINIIDDIVRRFRDIENALL